MRVAFIGDTVGKPARYMVRKHLSSIREKYNIDLVIANTENASHGFGLSTKNAKELFDSGIDVMTGGNHTWDKQEIMSLFDTMPVLRPHNYPPEVKGSGLYKLKINDQKIAILNLMGMYAMPQVENPFRCAIKEVDLLLADGYNNIFIDFHAESTAEKRTLMMMLKEKVTAIVGTHTHIGTDDLEICDDCAYVSDIGLSGCRDGVIGVDAQAPIKRAMTGLMSKFDIPNQCKKILQLIVVDFADGKAGDAFKLKAYDDEEATITMRAIR